MKEKNEKKDFRESISKYLVFTIVGTTLVIGLIVLKKSYGSTEFDLSFIGQTLLPLWATWVGTILAFYFGKSNFEAATKSYQEIIKTLTPEEKMASIKVKEVMVPFNLIKYIEFKNSATKKIVEIIQDKDFKEYNRFAFIDENKVLKYMIHRIAFTNFITEKAISNTPVNDITFETFINECTANKYNYILKNSAFISINANLLDAKLKMDNIKDCKDVFVTTTGNETEPILGLITNNTIYDNAKV